MNKMMMTPAGTAGRPASADLLSLNGLGRPTPDNGDSAEASGGFARLLQANANAQAAAQSRSAALARTSPPAAAPTPVPQGQPHAATKAPERPPGDASADEAPTESPRAQDTARAAQRHAVNSASRGTARNAENAEAAPGKEPADPVLAQVLRHLRGQADVSDATGGTEGTEEEASSPRDAVDDSATTGADLAQALAAGQGLASPLAQALAPTADATERAPALSTESGLTTKDRHASKDLVMIGDPNGPDALSADAELRQQRDARAAERTVGLSAGGQGVAIDVQSAARTQATDAAATDTASTLAAATATDSFRAVATQAAAEGTASAKSDALSGPPGSFAGLLHQAQASAVADKASAERLTGSRYELQSPLHSAGFAPEMSARLSLAAADGVQQAQLHLNPAEMGPVQVQIVLDGQQAQISFVAEQADTRAVLEKSLPELAGALREQGLTLSGGGVFSQQQAPQDPNAQADAQGGRSSPRGSGSRPEGQTIEEPAGLRIQAPVTRSRGVLDLFA